MIKLGFLLLSSSVRANVVSVVNANIGVIALVVIVIVKIVVTVVMVAVVVFVVSALMIQGITNGPKKPGVNGT